MKNKMLNENKKVKKIAYTALFFVLLILVWHLVSVTVFAHSGALPTPAAVLKKFFGLLSESKFYRAIFSTLGRSILSFVCAFILGAALGFAASKFEGALFFAEPLVTILRSVPTLGVTFILLMFFRGTAAAVVVAALVTLPLTYSGAVAVLAARDKKIYEMAHIYKIKNMRIFTRIFLPASAPHIFESVRAGMGLNLKVVIAAEIIAIPRVSIGSSLSGSYSAGDFASLFAWVITAILVCFVIEGAIKTAAKLLMPFKGKAGRYD